MAYKIGVISDTHANLPALEVVLDYLYNEEGIDELLCAGDYVGYYAEPLKVLKRLKDECKIGVKGNHDRAALMERVADFKREIIMYNPIAAEAIKYHRKKLLAAKGTPEWKYLHELPDTKKFEIEGHKFFLVHGSPDDPDEYIIIHENQIPSTYMQDRIKTWFKELKVDIIILGHTHLPFYWKFRNKLIFNPGSVGQPRDGNPKASCAILTLKGKEKNVKIVRLEYPIDETVSRLKKANLPKFLGDRLYKGR